MKRPRPGPAPAYVLAALLVWAAVAYGLLNPPAAQGRLIAACPSVSLR
jgi:hypothetical protein